MAFRIYVVPMTTTVRANGTYRTPKYFSDGTIPPPNPPAGVLSYGSEPWCLVGADLSSADDATIVSKSDVQALPFDLTPTLTAPQVTGIRNFLEAANIASKWVSTADTWMGVFRSVAGMFTFWQRYSGIYAATNAGPVPSVFAGGVTLDTTFGSLPAAVQAAILATAVDQGISTTGLVAGTPLRAIEKAMADFYATKVYNFNGTLV